MCHYTGNCFFFFISERKTKASSLEQMCGRKRNRRRRRLNGFRRMGNSLIINLSFFFGKRRVGSSRKSLSWRISLSAFCISCAPWAGGNPILRKRKELSSTYVLQTSRCTSLPLPLRTGMLWLPHSLKFHLSPLLCGRGERKSPIISYGTWWFFNFCFAFLDFVASAKNFLLPN